MSDMDDKLKAAKAYLGERWVFHPRFTTLPGHRVRHSVVLHEFVRQQSRSKS